MRIASYYLLLAALSAAITSAPTNARSEPSGLPQVSKTARPQIHTSPVGYLSRLRLAKQAIAPLSGPFDILPALFSIPIFDAKQSVCVGSHIYDAEEFPDSPPFTASEALRWSNSTVRLRIPHPSTIAELIEPVRLQTKATEFSLGAFQSFAGKDQGICSGALIAGNILITAGHCIAKSYWTGTLGLEYPHFVFGVNKRELSEEEFAKLLVVDFNKQLNLSKQASALGLFVFPERQYQPFTVRRLIRLKYDENEHLDYAILHINGTREQIGDYAVGVSNLRTAPLKDDEHILVSQHPSGGYKKISTGRASSQTYRILHFASTAQGSSGAPLFDQRGRLIGIQTEGFCEDAGRPNLALPLSLIYGTLNQALQGRI